MLLCDTILYLCSKDRLISVIRASPWLANNLNKSCSPVEGPNPSDTIYSVWPAVCRASRTECIGTSLTRPRYADVDNGPDYWNESRVRVLVVLARAARPRSLGGVSRLRCTHAQSLWLSDSSSRRFALVLCVKTRVLRREQGHNSANMTGQQPVARD